MTLEEIGKLAVERFEYDRTPFGEWSATVANEIEDRLTHAIKQYLGEK